MRQLAVTLRDFASHFAASHQLILVGGLAVSVRTEPRFTRDVDFTAAVASDAEAESLIYAAQQLGYLVESTLEQSSTKRLATVRLRRGKGPLVDLLFAACGIEREIGEEANPLTVLGQRIPVAAIGHLMAMKLVSRDPKKRPRDDDDLLALARFADEAEWARATTAVSLIEARGFARNRDLRTALRELQASHFTNE